jgi:hypothetical protein
MPFQKQPPQTVLLNGKSSRDKAKYADFVLPVINAQNRLEISQGN